MQPHTAAILNIFNYIKQQDMEKRFVSGVFDVVVQDGGGKYYTIEVNKSGGGYRAIVNGLWSCTADVSISGDQATISHHKHSLVSTNIVEKAYLSSGTVNGKIEDSNGKKMDGDIAASSTGKGQTLSFYRTPKGNKPDSKITNVKKLELRD